MRTVHLVPEHSQWWLLSPGLTLYYDRIRILKADYDRVFMESSHSSYNEQLATNLSYMEKNSPSHIEVVNTMDGLRSDYDTRAESLREYLYKSAEDDDDTTVDPSDLLDLALNAFTYWIQYNERKTRFLRRDEKYYTLLASELLPSWVNRQRTIQQIRSSQPAEIIGQLRENKEAESSLTRLLHSALRCIDLVDAGIQIYDPMLPEYLPAIALIERLRTARVFANQGGDVFRMFSAYQIRMAHYFDILPIKINWSELFEEILEYDNIRRNLERVDSTLTSIDELDPATAFSEAKEVIHPLVQECRAQVTATNYGLWAVGLISTIASIIGAPTTTEQVENIVGFLATRPKHGSIPHCGHRLFRAFLTTATAASNSLTASLRRAMTSVAKTACDGSLLGSL